MKTFKEAYGSRITRGSVVPPVHTQGTNFAAEPPPVDEEEAQQKFKIYFTTALNPDGEDAEGWISYGTDKEDAWDNLYNYFKSIPPGPGYRGRNLMSFWHVQIEPYKEGDPCSTAMGPCEDITGESEDQEEVRVGNTFNDRFRHID